jgi:hypothetical protein
MWYTVFGTNEVFDSFESSRSTNKTPPLTASGNMCKKAVGRLINFSIDDDMPCVVMILTVSCWMVLFLVLFYNQPITFIAIRLSLVGCVVIRVGKGWFFFLRGLTKKVHIENLVVVRGSASECIGL